MIGTGEGYLVGLSLGLPLVSPFEYTNPWLTVIILGKSFWNSLGFLLDFIWNINWCSPWLGTWQFLRHIKWVPSLLCLLDRSQRPPSLFIIRWCCSNPQTAAWSISRLYPSKFRLLFSCPMMVLVPPPPPSPPSNIPPGSLPIAVRPFPLYFSPLPPLCPCLFIWLSPSSSVWSPVVRTADFSGGLLTNALSWFPASRMKVCPPDLCGWWYLDWVWVEGRRRRRPPR